ncbi:MAG: hypothetical protein HY363_03310 [Candidatus Aenigmarchaeota archaeon]|nr:hypothetical protein [Candidatus Aenigmarchaeota archaeon]
MAKGLKCGCGPVNLLWMVIASAVSGAGVLLAVNGVALQWVQGMNVMVWVWYAAAAFVLRMGCGLKCRAMQGCPMHSA